MSYINTLRGLISDSVARIARIDASTHSLQIVDYAHHEIHSGSHFFLVDYTTINNGNNLDFLFVVPDTSKWPHAVWEMEAEVEMTFNLYEDVTTSADGSAVTPFNNNRNSATAATVGAYTGPTLAGGALGDNGQGGTKIWGKTIGQGKKIGGEFGREQEIVGKQNVKYWFRISNGSGSNGWLNYDFSWYEHTDKD